MTNLVIKESIGALEEQGIAVVSLATDSRLVNQGDVFLAYLGEKTDGRKFISQAIESGAVAIIWDRDNFIWNKTWQIPNVGVSDLKMKVGYIADYICGSPSQKLWMVGITGTNGKTSCSHWVADCLSTLGRKTAIIGTLGNGFSGALVEGSNTTPDATVLHRDLSSYVKDGAQCAVMEVSSIGIEQGRTNGIHFDVALFTNLTRDHLDYHGTLKAYGEAKAKLFNWPNLSYAIFNIDDEFGKKLFYEKREVQTIGYGFNALSDTSSKFVFGSNLKLSEKGVGFEINSSYGKATLKSSLLGAFNASNLLAVVSILLVSGVTLEDAVRVVSFLKPVNGRMQCFGGGNKPLVVVDYAHTPDALEKTLETLKELLPQDGRLLCVFGCGGDRDRGKRPIMGEIATRLAHKVFITSDNPRSEDPQAIIQEILTGVKNNTYEVMEDRGSAIQQAIKCARVGDIVLIAGKGHETYQEIKGIKHPFSDIETAEQALISIA